MPSRMRTSPLDLADDNRNRLTAAAPFISYILVEYGTHLKSYSPLIPDVWSQEWGFSGRTSSFFSSRKGA